MEKITETHEQALTEVDELIQKLYVEKYTAMCRTAFSSLNDYGLAETAVQETFLVALRFREKFAASQNPVGWLYKALSYTVKHIKRDRNAALACTLPLDTLGEKEAVHYDYYSVIDDQVKESEDVKLLAEMYLSGYTLKEIAESRGISIGACKMRIKRAKERLRKKLQ